MSLARLVGYCAGSGLPVALINEQSSLVEVGRNRLVSTAKKAGATHIFMLDSDMTFPPDTLAHLANVNVDVAWANYNRRRNPIKPVCDPAKGHLATGCALIDMKVFESNKGPWFRVEWDGLKYTGEDVFFSKWVSEAGFSTACVDVDIGHIGTIVR